MINEPALKSIDDVLVDTGLTSSRLVNLAVGIDNAYTAYNNNTMPTLTGYGNITVVQVYEIAPWGNPFSSLGAIESGDGEPQGIVSYQQIGFSAVANDLSHNILVLRGTVTYEETGYDLLYWDSKVPCQLPYDNPLETLGNANEGLYDLYGESGLLYDSLATSFQAAISQLALINPGKPLYIAAHSLGGALATLGAIDTVLSGSYGNGPLPVLITFGSLHVGDPAFKQAFDKLGILTLRFANLCDFVPSLVSLYPPSNKNDILPENGYTHVGIECTFVWQKWDDWRNHSMSDTYLAVVQNYLDVVKIGPRVYPQ